MISKEDICRALRQDLGFNALHSLDEIGLIPQSTMERRLLAGRKKNLSRAFIAAIYATWLQDKVYRDGGKLAPAVIDIWLQFLTGIGCDQDMLADAWLQAALSHLEKWLQVMAPDEARDVRIGVKVEIVKRLSTGEYMKFQYQPSTSAGPDGYIVSERPPPVEIHGDCQVCGAKDHSSGKCPGMGFGYGPRSSPESAVADDQVQGSPQASVPRRQDRNAGFTRQTAGPGISVGAGSHGKPVDSLDAAAAFANLSIDGDNQTKHVQHKLKQWDEMTDDERRALVQADAFLDELAESQAAKEACRPGSSESTGEPAKAKPGLSPVDEEGGPPHEDQQVTLPRRPAEDAGEGSSFVKKLFSNRKSVVRNTKTMSAGRSEKPLFKVRH
ncbi:hypothetical protein L249_4053 [Ophiocordyceps polyrhachis-furcata BCC 54312]|uniref:Uncharacterized protein n=1 Tax=Ophiocordyceps polyrhachis-furcata BCC 54312 TaxID=1330021 RepID=A0A367L5U3_9HYPO|nr:hypothetical protein L249_4053 [Ophiocordyceps polyrhachis-furcata BCC 54312]